jgi:hypothetical protein
LLPRREVPATAAHCVPKRMASCNRVEREEAGGGMSMPDKYAAGGCDFIAHPLDYNHSLFPHCVHGPALVFARFKQVSISNVPAARISNRKLSSRAHFKPQTFQPRAFQTQTFHS